MSLGIDKAMATIKVTSCHKKFGVGMNSQDKARNALCDTWVEIYVDIHIEHLSKTLHVQHQE